MEIDLNLAVGEVEKNACNNGGECDKLGVSIYMELWHACAGPLTTLPKKGNLVVYFPQGHLEQVASRDMSNFDLPPQIFCRVLDVQLLANRENDDVYAQLTVLPTTELIGAKLDDKEIERIGVHEDGDGVTTAKSTSHMFCKTLTASDTSTHGGFSVPRRAAEDCFPPLDYKEQRPSQELIAKDIHGIEWKFRHIYRGQPRRHLLTTGWSIFISQKNLVSGDAVLFLRGEGGELRLGIRRAARPRNVLPDSIIKNQNTYPSVLSSVANALSSKSAFQVFYSPRASLADFIVPYHKYVKSTTNQLPVGARFKMRFDIDDSPERRFCGVVTGVGDVDPYRWPNSKWRCLMVRWDEDIMSNHQDRVSPWDIDFSVTSPHLSFHSSQRMKKLRSSLPHNSQIAGGTSLLNFEESVRSSKVLQGQENVSLVSPLFGRDRINHQLDFEIQPAARQNPLSNVMEKPNFSEFVNKHAPAYTGSVDTNWFPMVLQGQEICSLRSLSGKTDFNLGAWPKPEFGRNVHKVYQTPGPNLYPLASEGARNIFFPYNVPSYMSDVQRESHVLNSTSVGNVATFDIGKVPSLSNPLGPLEKSSTSTTPEEHFLNTSEAILKGEAPTFKLFGSSLTEDISTLNSLGSSKRSCTKVHKQGNLVGRAIDLSRLHGYDDLLTELERLFSMEGLLQDPEKGWRILYTDSENDMMVVGDDPWHEFVEVVSKIHIHTQEEVEKMTMGMISDDTQSCLEEVPPVTDVSKSSSVG
ncbi:auxin response factor 4 [Olea europaea subsp. europaea]|uniref:Auxin response factor n=1 Tax=Olea europaea subsp. europaea TaxID=158383 RepID=A0A8S0TTY5_OLEEU|nr:auxin response factor 4 [Olea europaea subsp. europaea]